MTVFKGYLKIMKRNSGLILMYLAIFLGITLLVQAASGEEESGIYQAEAVKIAVIDEDGGALSEGLIAYLSGIHDVTRMENDKKALQENLFYRNIEYIVKIPADFEEKCLENGEKLSATKIPGSYAGYYVDQQITSYLNNILIFQAAGYTTEEAVAVSVFKEPEVRMLDVNKNGGEMPGYAYYYRYMPYFLICVLCYVLGTILTAFHKPDIQNRMKASAVSSRRQNLEALLAAGVLGAALWGICILVSTVYYGSTFLKSPGVWYYILNSFAMLLVALSLSYMVGMFARNSDALNGIVNSLSLGMCFLCGVFVPLDIMNERVKTAAQFLPVYWYEKTNELLAASGTITGNLRVEIWKSYAIQVLFAAAIVGVALVIGRRKRLGT